MVGWWYVCGGIGGWRLADGSGLGSGGGDAEQCGRCEWHNFTNGKAELLASMVRKACPAGLCNMFAQSCWNGLT